MTVTPVHKLIGARIEELHVTHDTDSDVVSQLWSLIRRYDLLIIPNQRLTDEQQIEFS